MPTGIFVGFSDDKGLCEKFHADDARIKVQLSNTKNVQDNKDCFKCNGSGLVSYDPGIRRMKHCDCQKRKAGWIDENSFTRYNDLHDQRLTTEDLAENTISPTYTYHGKAKKYCTGKKKECDFTQK